MGSLELNNGLKWRVSGAEKKYPEKGALRVANTRTTLQCESPSYHSDTLCSRYDKDMRMLVKYVVYIVVFKTVSYLG